MNHGKAECLFIGIYSQEGRIVRDNFILVNNKSLRIIGPYKIFDLCSNS